jgi:alpha-1,3-rhamnosyl/mannosyltransferase
LPIAQNSPFGTRLRDLTLWHLRHWGRTLAARRFRAACLKGRYDLYHEPNFIPFPCDCPTVVTIHDLSVLRHPEWHPADRVAYFEKNFQRGLSQACHFLAISEFGRQEIIRTLNVAPDRVTRTYMGIRRGLMPLSHEEVAGVLAKLGLPGQYLLYLGTIEPRKNVLRLMKAYCALPERLRSNCPLLLVGGWGWNTSDSADYFHNKARHRGVIHLGYVKDRYVTAVYNGARALVYPSLYEGFGLPPLEMMACGGAVIASTAGALVETIGRKACLVEPEDVDGWREAMTRALEDEDWLRSLRRGTPEMAKPFTWDQCAADTLGVYRRIANSMNGHRVAG